MLRREANSKEVPLPTIQTTDQDDNRVSGLLLSLPECGPQRHMIAR